MWNIFNYLYLWTRGFGANMCLSKSTSMNHIACHAWLHNFLIGPSSWNSVIIFIFNNRLAHMFYHSGLQNLHYLFRRVELISKLLHLFTKLNSMYNLKCTICFLYLCIYILFYTLYLLFYKYMILSFPPIFVFMDYFSSWFCLHWHDIFRRGNSMMKPSFL